MDNQWEAPEFEELTVNAECSAYSAELAAEEE